MSTMFHNAHTRNRLDSDIVLLTSSCNSFIDGYQEGLLAAPMPISASNPEGLLSLFRVGFILVLLVIGAYDRGSWSLADSTQTSRRIELGASAMKKIDISDHMV